MQKNKENTKYNNVSLKGLEKESEKTYNVCNSLEDCKYGDCYRETCSYDDYDDGDCCCNDCERTNADNTCNDECCCNNSVKFTTSTNNDAYKYTMENTISINKTLNEMLSKKYYDNTKVSDNNLLSLDDNTVKTDFQDSLSNVLTGLYLFLSTKNKNYGNSALSPVRVFSKAEPEDGILQRMDDKLSRIKNSTNLRKNDIVDLMGYLAILCINKGWTDFTDLID